MKHLYRVEIRVDLAKLNSKVDKVLGILNENMKSFGFNENVKIISEFNSDFTSNRELTKEELNIIETNYNKVDGFKVLNIYSMGTFTG